MSRFPRLKGRNTSVTLNEVGVGSWSGSELAFARSCDFEFEINVEKQGYLGSAGEMREENFDGARGKITFHINDMGVFTLLSDIISRAKGVSKLSTEYNINTSFNAPWQGGGTSRSLVARNVSFSNIPFSIPDQKSHVDLTLDWETDDADIMSEVAA